MNTNQFSLPDMSWLSHLELWLPLALVVALYVLFWFGLRKVFEARDDTGSRYREQGARFILNAVLVLMLILAAPVNGELKGQLLSLFGILMSATIALSSTTVMGNLMAGIMLRVVRSFSIGDFVRVNGQLGKVSGVGLLHVEIQTEDSDLVTMPNLVLIQQSFVVVRATGTVIHAEVSLGYDVNRHDVQEALLQAVEQAELEDGFVLVRELGDFSVLYSVHGRLRETRQIVTARSRLRAAMLDSLHDAGIEIVSPSFMNQRRLEADMRMIPGKKVEQKREDAAEAEELLFDKAEKAELAHRLEKRLKSVQEYVEKLKKEKAGLREEKETEELEEKLQHWLQREEKVRLLLEEVQESAK